MTTGINQTCNKKPIKRGIVVIYIPNNCDFRRFQSKLTSKMTSNNAKIEKLSSNALNRRQDKTRRSGGCKATRRRPEGSSFISYYREGRGGRHCFPKCLCHSHYKVKETHYPSISTVMVNQAIKIRFTLIQIVHSWYTDGVFSE